MDWRIIGARPIQRLAAASYMELSHLFEVSPFLALSFCVCLGTVTWCIILLRRGCHHVSDRLLIGFIGLLAVYQSFQILRRGGVLPMTHLHHFDEAIDLLVNALYLLAALLLRMSNHDRFQTIFQLRLAEAQPAAPLHESLREPDAPDPSWDPKIVEQIRAAAERLSPNSLKLFLYICFHADGRSGSLEVTENDLLQWTSTDRKALFSGFKELREKGFCDVEVGQANRSVRIVSTPTAGGSAPERAPASL
jgi:hypothetical protein